MNKLSGRRKLLSRVALATAATAGLVLPLVACGSDEIVGQCGSCGIESSPIDGGDGGRDSGPMGDVVTPLDGGQDSGPIGNVITPIDGGDAGDGG